MPCHGVGLTGPVKKTLLGTFAKDKGEFSSRLGQVMKQAAKTPGPGKYIGHTVWVDNKKGGSRTIYETVNKFGNAFEKSARDFKPLHKVPEPARYERKDFSTAISSIATKDCLSTKRRVKYGKCSKGKRRNFLDNVSELAKGSPTPGQYTTSHCVPRNMLEVHISGPSFEKKQTESRKPASKGTPAPDTYKPSFALCENQEPNYSVPKCEGNDFVTKACKAKWIDKKTQMPAPGKHDLVGLSKISRGTKALCLGGLGRGTCSGYF